MFGIQGRIVYRVIGPRLWVVRGTVYMVNDVSAHIGDEVSRRHGTAVDVATHGLTHGHTWATPTTSPTNRLRLPWVSHSDLISADVVIDWRATDAAARIAVIGCREDAM